MAAFSISTIAEVKEENGKFHGDCDTSSDILGPFYRPKAPERSDLLMKGLQGTIITIKGKVFQQDCITPIANAQVEIWHCNSKGEYDNESDKYLHRALWFTDVDGNYSFKTIIPGKYLNGKLYRPAHIHFRVTAKNQKELISQLYFQGDPHITDDPWASKQEAQHRILPIIPEDTKGNIVVQFDIYLKDK